MSNTLKELALAASEGPWFRRANTEGWRASHDGYGLSEYRPLQDKNGNVIALVVAQSPEHFVELDTLSNTAYIAAASPDVVLALISERDELKAENERLRNELAAMTNSFNALKTELDAANEPCAWCAGNR